jgi:hypothetical protein
VTTPIRRAGRGLGAAIGPAAIAVLVIGMSP